MQIPEDRSVVMIPTIIILSFFFLVFLSLNPTTTRPKAVVNTTVTSSPQPNVDTAPSVSTDATGTRVIDQTVSYNNPAGGDTVRFVLTVAKDGIIKDAQAEVKANPQHRTSVEMQTNFANALKGEVVGKQLSNLKVDRIGGASLTSGAFKKFLSDIQS